MKWRDNPDASVRNEEAVANLLHELRELVVRWRQIEIDECHEHPTLSGAADDLEEVLGD